MHLNDFLFSLKLLGFFLVDFQSSFWIFLENTPCFCRSLVIRHGNWGRFFNMYWAYYNNQFLHLSSLARCEFMINSSHIYMSITSECQFAHAQCLHFPLVLGGWTYIEKQLLFLEVPLLVAQISYLACLVCQFFSKKMHPIMQLFTLK